MQNSTHGRAQILADIRDEFRARRSARAAHKALEQDLAGYTTPAELTELTEILRRYDDGDTADIRRILDRRRAA